MSQSDLHKAALALAANGVPVFPCWPDTKTPATTHGLHDASSDPAQIDAWWSEEPAYNIAYCPHLVGLAVVDIDAGPHIVGVDGEANWAATEMEHGVCPETFTVRTPRGGRHLYFLGELPPTQSKIAEHVDTRGVGSYVLAPPSLFQGKPYVLENDVPFARLPEWIGPLARSRNEKARAAADVELDQPANISRARELLNRYVKTNQVAIEGQMGDAKTYITACEVLNLGLTAETALDLLVELWNPHCEPPWDEDELAAKVQNAAAYSQNEAGAWAVAPAQDVFKDALGKLCLDDEPVQRSRFDALTLDEIASLPPPTWLIPETLPDKALSLMYGPPGSYKSFVALTWGLELASRGKSVIYIGAEGGRGLELRATAWELVNAVPRGDRFRIVQNMPWASDGGMIQEFIEVSKKLKPDLVIIDTAARMMVGMNENDAKDMGMFVAAMDAIKIGLDCAVLAIHHTGKDDSRGARGSIALTAAVDAAFEVQADKATRAVSVTCRRQKDAAEREEPWTYEGREAASSLAFVKIDAGEYHRLTSAGDDLPRHRVGAMLMELKANGDESAVTTHVLATALAGPNEDHDSHAVQVGQIEGALRRKSKAGLIAYCIGSGASLRWCLPA